ncbi:MAG: thioredoxin family protein [Mycoplasma sp.]
MNKMLWKDAIDIIENDNVYLYCGSDWCKDCKEMLPIVESISQLALEKNWNLKFINIDAQEANLFRDPDTKYKVIYVPAHILIKNGNVIEIFYEIQTKEFLINKIKEIYGIN